MKSAGAQDYGGGAHLLLGSVAPPQHGPGRAAPVHHQRTDLEAGGDGEIRPGPRTHVQIRGGGRDPRVVPVGEGRREDPVLELAVLIDAPGQPRRIEGAGDRMGEGRPCGLQDAPDRERPIMAVQRTAAIEVGLEPAEIRQYVVPGPALGAERGPGLVIAGQPAVGRLDVDAGRAAHHPALLVGPPPHATAGVAGDRRVEPRPDVGVAMEQRHRIAVEDLRRHPARRCIDAGFDEEHPAPRVGGEPVGHHAAGRAPADDQHVDRFGQGVHGISRPPRASRRRTRAPRRDRPRPRREHGCA